MAEYGEIGEEDLQELLNVKRTRVYPVARQMMAQELIESSAETPQTVPHGVWEMRLRSAKDAIELEKQRRLW